MAAAEIPEAELQAWFEKATRRRTLSAENEEALEGWADQLKQSNRATERTTREGVARAIRICHVLGDADHLSENRSVSAPGCAQMRPDLILTSDSGHYVLVELKTKSGAERQGVQELLAYSAAIKTQAPYINDFMFVIVARYWDELLTQATRALIMDGKHVLPLQVTEKERAADGSRDFSLSIRLDLFEFNFVQFFDPWQAFVPAEIGVYRPVSWRGADLAVDSYLREVARSAMYDACRQNQTGFAFFWTKRDGNSNSELGCATLVTVNQHWRESEALDGWYPRFSTRKLGFHGLHQKAVAGNRRAVRWWSETHGCWIDSAGSGVPPSEVYKQSMLSYELLERYRSIESERQHRERVKGLGWFELNGGYEHLKMFMEEWAGRPMLIRTFAAFGEFADFMRDEELQGPRYHEELHELIELFKAHKMKHPDALPDRYPPEVIKLMQASSDPDIPW